MCTFLPESLIKAHSCIIMASLQTRGWSSGNQQSDWKGANACLCVIIIWLALGAPATSSLPLLWWNVRMYSPLPLNVRIYSPTVTGCSYVVSICDWVFVRMYSSRVTCSYVLPHCGWMFVCTLPLWLNACMYSLTVIECSYVLSPCVIICLYVFSPCYYMFICTLPLLPSTYLYFYFNSMNQHKWIICWVCTRNWTLLGTLYTFGNLWTYYYMLMRN